MAKWKMMIGNAKHRTCLPGTKTSITHHLANKQAPQQGNTPLAAINGYKWEGNMADGVDGPYTEADAVFYVPTVTPMIPGGIQELATWVGIGGLHTNDDLVQAGVVQSYNTGLTPANYAFYEDYPQENAMIINCPTNNPHSNTPCKIAPGDRMQVQVKYTDYYYVGDGTQGWYFSLQDAYPNADTANAEWVIELPDPSVAQLMQFQPITFYGMGDTQGNGVYTGPYWQTHDYLVLLGYYTDDVLATIGPLEYNTTYGPPDDSNTIYFQQCC